MLTRLALFVALVAPIAHAHAQEAAPERNGFAGFGIGYSMSPLEIRTISEGVVKHTHAGPGPLLTIGHRERYFRVYGELLLGAIETTSETGGAKISSDLGMVFIGIDGTLPVGRNGHLFAGTAFGEVTYETTIEEPGSKTVVDHTDLVNTLEAGYIHAIGRTSIEAGARYTINDEKQDSGAYVIESESVTGGYVAVKFAF